MQAPVFEAFLTAGQRRFAEFRNGGSVGYDRNDSDSEERYHNKGKNAFREYTDAPDEFIIDSHSEQIESALIPSQGELLKKEVQEPAVDMLDALMKMPVQSKSPPRSFTAEHVTYAFEESLMSDSSPQKLPRDTSPAKDLNWVERENAQRSLHQSKASVEEQQTSSEVESTRGSESIAGFRSSERIERKSNFGVLQEHINTLTEENCDLKRALELQQKLTASLTQENQTLGDEYNLQAHKLEELQKKCEQQEAILLEQQEALESLKHAQEMSHAAEKGAQDRVRALVQENVLLEDKVRDTRVSQIRLEKALEQLREEKEALVKRERQIENENRNLTDILNNIREENNLLRAQVHVPHNANLETQIATASLWTRQPTERAIPKPVPRMVNAETQTVPNEEAPSSDSTPAGSATNISDRISDKEILQIFALPEGADNWTEEQTVMSSINELIAALDDQRKAMIGKLRAAKAKNQHLEAENRTLLQKISSQTQILEMHLQRAAQGQIRDNTEQTTAITPSPSHVASAKRPESQSQQASSGIFGWFGERNRHKAVDSYMR